MSIERETCPVCGNTEKYIDEPCFKGICLRRRLRAVFEDPDQLAEVESSLAQEGFATNLVIGNI